MTKREEKYTHPDLREDLKEIQEVRDYEKRHKNRKTLVESLDRNV